MTTARRLNAPRSLVVLAPLFALACGEAAPAPVGGPGRLIEESIPSASQQPEAITGQDETGSEALNQAPRPAAPAEALNTEPDPAEPTTELPVANEPGQPPAAELSDRGCTAPPGVSNAPQNVEQLLELINSLPTPVTLACFVSSLQRPLEVFLTSSKFSAQPAGFNSPRSFLFFGPLVLSVVPGGESRNLLEFGERTHTGRSIKGEIVFPIVDAVDEDTLFDQVALSSTGSICGGCHVAETRRDDQPYNAAFESVVILPDLRYEVTPERLAEDATRCDWQHEAERCELLDALFGYGAVVATEQWR